MRGQARYHDFLKRGGIKKMFKPFFVSSERRVEQSDAPQVL